MNANQSNKLLALITARGGSKGLPRKNVLSAGGKPLIAWTITAALESKAIDRVCLSSDDDEIIEVAKAWGCNVPFRRPPELASDATSSIDVVLHALEQLSGYRYIVLLQPTSPLRTAEDIDTAFELLLSSGAPSCVSVCKATQSPYWMYRMDDHCKLVNLFPEQTIPTRRQDLSPVYIPNGAIYIAHADWLRNTKDFLGEGCVAYQMPNDRSVDIDNEDEFNAFCRKVVIN